MKRFIDENGMFEINVPDTWKYIGKFEKIHTFKDRRKWRPDKFQVSINEFENEEQLNKFLNMIKTWQITRIGDNEYYTNTDELMSKNYTIIDWIKILDNKVVFFDYNYLRDPEEFFDNRTLIEKIETINEIIKSFKLVDYVICKNEIDACRFENFGILELFGIKVYLF